MNGSHVTHRFPALTISGFSLIIAVVYVLFSPNWIGPGVMWILGTVILWTISSIGLTVHLAKHRDWHLLKSIFVGIGILLMYGFVFLFMLWWFVASNMNQTT